MSQAAETRREGHGEEILLEREEVERRESRGLIW
jgi:hypothetical protein